MNGPERGYPLARIEELLIGLRDLGADCVVHAEDSDEAQMRAFLEFLADHLPDLAEKYRPR
jgi:hypothetical protein